MTSRTLLLLRNAKSSWDQPELNDYERPLAARGRNDAPLMGREIARRGWSPDVALVSSSARTRQTWELVAPQLPASVHATFTSAIYEASASHIFSEIRKTPPAISTLLVVGHNPGLEDVACQLAGDGSNTEAMRRISQKFPTAALACLTFDGLWAGLETARLSAFLRPKELG